MSELIDLICTKINPGEVFGRDVPSSGRRRLSGDGQRRAIKTLLRPVTRECGHGPAASHPRCALPAHNKRPC